MKYAIAFWLLAATPALAETCALDLRSAPNSPQLFSGIVRGPATEQEVRSQTAVAVARVHAPVSPKYANLPRVYVFYQEGGVRRGTIAAVLDAEMPRRGDSVIVASRRRDPDAACAFIPWTVTKGAPA